MLKLKQDLDTQVKSSNRRFLASHPCACSMVRLPDLNPLGRTKRVLNQSCIDLYGLSRKNSIFDKLKRRFSQSERDISSLGLDITRSLQTSVVGSCQDDGFIMYNVMSSLNDESNSNSDAGNCSNYDDINYYDGHHKTERGSYATFDDFSDIFDIIQGKGITTNSTGSGENEPLVKKDHKRLKYRNGFIDNELVIANKSSNDPGEFNEISDVLKRSSDLNAITVNDDCLNRNSAFGTSEFINIKDAESMDLTKESEIINDVNGTRCLDSNSSEKRDFEIESSGARRINVFATDSDSKDVQLEDNEIQDVDHKDGSDSEVILNFSPKAIDDLKTEVEFCSKNQTADYANVDKGPGIKTNCAKEDLCIHNLEAGDVLSTHFGKISVSFDHRNDNLKSQKDLIEASQIGCNGERSASIHRCISEKNSTEDTERLRTSSHSNEVLDSGESDGADGNILMHKFSTNEGLTFERGCVIGGRVDGHKKDMFVSQNGNDMIHKRNRINYSKSTREADTSEMQIQVKGGRKYSARQNYRERSSSEESVLKCDKKSANKCNGRTRRLFSAPDLLQINPTEKAYLESIYKEKQCRPRSMSLKSALKRRPSELNGNALRVRFDLRGSKEEKFKGECQTSESHSGETSVGPKHEPKNEPKKNWRYVIKKFRIKQSVVDLGVTENGSNEKTKQDPLNARTGAALKGHVGKGHATHETEISLESIKEFKVLLPNMKALKNMKEIPKLKLRCNGAVASTRCMDPCSLEPGDGKEAGGSTVPLLHVAASDGNIKLLKRLIDVGVDLNAKDGNGWPAIHYAIIKGNFQCAALLLDNGVDVNCYTDDIVKDYCKTIRQVFMHKTLLENNTQSNSGLVG